MKAENLFAASGVGVSDPRGGISFAKPDVVKTKLVPAVWYVAGVYLRRCYRAKDGKRHAYGALVKSVRTAKGPRQEVVAYLGEMDEAGRLGIEQVASGRGDDPQQAMFDRPQPRWVEGDLSGVRVQDTRSFGGPWLTLEWIDKLGLRDLLEGLIPAGREEVPWALMSLLLVYKARVQTHLKNRLGELLELKYDLLLYDVASTYFEGQAEGNPLARRGYWRENVVTVPSSPTNRRIPHAVNNGPGANEP